MNGAQGRIQRRRIRQHQAVDRHRHIHLPGKFAQIGQVALVKLDVGQPLTAFAGAGQHPVREIDRDHPPEMLRKKR